MEEYDQARQDAQSLSDSVMAVVDYLAVYELANGGDLDAAESDVPSLMGQAFDRLRHAGSSRANRVLPTEFTITSAYPNPFNSSVRIHYELPEASELIIAIHDIKGREVASLFKGRSKSGRFETIWNAEFAPTGVYLLRIESGANIRTQKLMLLR